mgnify:CR=1 FL=1
MSVFKALVLTRILSMFSSMFSKSRVGKKRGLAFKLLIGFVAIYTIGAIGIMFGLLFESLCVPLYNAGLSWLYFSLMGILVMGIGFVGSIFAAQTQLFEAKDNELLLSMPIPSHMILASRISILLLMNYLYEAFVVIPAGIIYIIHQEVTVIGVIFFILIALLLPFMVLAISCLFGWLLGWITSKLRYKNIFTLIFSLVFLVVYLGIYSQIQNYLKLLIENGETIARAIEKTMPAIYHLGNAIEEESIISFIIFALFSLIPFILVYIILSKNFIKIVTSNKGVAKIRYQEKSLKVSNAKAAFIKKELRFFFSSPMYILNASMGAIFMLILSVVLVIKKEMLMQILIEIPQIDIYLSGVIIAGLCLLATYNIISAPSISLEGKRLWIARSLPIDAGEILLSKAKSHIVICMPAVIVAATTCAILLPMTALQVILLYLLPSVVTIFTGLFGVVVNLHFPKFDWISETTAVKQGLSTMISMFGSFVIISIPILLYMFLLISHINLEWYLFICFILFVTLSYGLYKYLVTKGKRMFERL